MVESPSESSASLVGNDMQWGSFVKLTPRPQRDKKVPIRDSVPDEDANHTGGSVTVKRRYLLALVVVVLIAIPAVVFAGDRSLATGRANLHPANGSGVHAVINFVDDPSGGGTLTVTGTATGLEPTPAVITDQFFPFRYPLR